MAAIPAPTPSLINPTNEYPFIHRFFMPAATIVQGQVCIWNASRQIVPSGGTAPAAGVAIAGIAMRNERPGGQALSVFQQGFLWGYDLTGRALYDLVYAGINGTLDSAATVIIGEILPFNSAGDLAVWIDVQRTWGIA